MPIYEYHCEACGADFEELILSRSAQDDVKCKSCGSAQIVKLLSSSAVRSVVKCGMAPQNRCEVAPNKAGSGGCAHRGSCGCA